MCHTGRLETTLDFTVLHSCIIATNTSTISWHINYLKASEHWINLDFSCDKESKTVETLTLKQTGEMGFAVTQWKKEIGVLWTRINMSGQIRHKVKLKQELQTKCADAQQEMTHPLALTASADTVTRKLKIKTRLNLQFETRYSTFMKNKPQFWLLHISFFCPVKPFMGRRSIFIRTNQRQWLIYVRGRRSRQTSFVKAMSRHPSTPLHL